MGRIGLLVPSSNTTVEPEFYRALPRDVTLHTARLFLTKIAPESILKMVEDMETQAKLLASADVDVIVLGATAPSFLQGLGYDREPEKVQRAEAALFAMYEKGQVKPHVMATFPVERYREALAVVRDRGVLGKVVMVF